MQQTDQLANAVQLVSSIAQLPALTKPALDQLLGVNLERMATEPQEPIQY